MLSPEPDFEPMQRLVAVSGANADRIIWRQPGAVFSLGPQTELTAKSPASGTQH